MEPIRIDVATPSRKYAVHLGDGTLERLPALCQELKQTAQKLSPQTKFTTRTGERRRGTLALVADRQDPT